MPGLEPKDIILAIIRKIGTGGATGHAIEYYGPAIKALSMEGRMTICNMSIEAGARAGLIAPDDVTIDYITRGERPFAPRGAALEAAIADWQTLRTDDDDAFDRRVTLDAGALVPQVTWGTNPAMTVDVTGVVPDPEDVPFAAPEDARRALEYMGLVPGTPITEIRGRRRLHRLVHQRADRRPAHGGPRVPGSKDRPGRPGPGRARQRGGPPSGRGRGIGPHFPGGRRRVAKGRLQHVPGDEPRQAQARPAIGQHQQPQLRRPPGAGRAHTSGQPGHGRRGRGHRAVHRRATHAVMIGVRSADERDLSGACYEVGSGVSRLRGFSLLVLETDSYHGAVHHTPWPRGAARLDRRQHRLDHPGPLPEKDRAHRLRSPALRRQAICARRCARGRQSRSARSGGRRSFRSTTRRYKGATVLVVGHNFGCGSSREHAVWAVMQAGYRAVIARGQQGRVRRYLRVERTSRTACWPSSSTRPTGRRSPTRHAKHPGDTEVTIDLRDQTVKLHSHADGSSEPVDTRFDFEIPEAHRHRLLHGLDAIGETLSTTGHQPA